MSTGWSEVETRVLGRIMVKVSSRVGERDGTPLYSMRVGTAQVTEDGSTRLAGHMSITDLDDALALLSALKDKYDDKQRAARRGRT